MNMRETGMGMGPQAEGCGQGSEAGTQDQREGRRNLREVLVMLTTVYDEDDADYMGDTLNATWEHYTTEERDGIIGVLEEREIIQQEIIDLWWGSKTRDTWADILVGIDEMLLNLGVEDIMAL